MHSERHGLYHTANRLQQMFIKSPTRNKITQNIIQTFAQFYRSHPEVCILCHFALAKDTSIDYAKPTECTNATTEYMQYSEF